MKTTTNYSAEFGPDVLRHRIILTYEAEAQAVTTDAIINQESVQRGADAV